MRRSFGIDMNACPNCNSENFKVVAVIEDYKVIEKILTHIGLQPRAPPITTARVQAELEYEEYID